MASRRSSRTSARNQPKVAPKDGGDEVRQPSAAVAPPKVESATIKKQTPAPPVQSTGIIPGLTSLDSDASDSAMKEEFDDSKAGESAKTPTETAKVGSKRKADDEEESMDVDSQDEDKTKDGKPRPKRKRKSGLIKTPKNALMQLNELKPGLPFELVSMTGPVHSPMFTIKVTVNGNEFEGTGTSKKRAKMQAAERALASFVQFRNASEAHLAMGRNVVNGDFTKDSDELVDAIMTDFNPKGPGEIPVVSNGKSPGAPKKRTDQPKNPVMVLNELRPPGLEYEFMGESGEAHNKVFTMVVKFENGKKFEGKGRNKKLAKNRAAYAALQEVYNIDCSLPLPVRTEPPVPTSDAPELPQTLADHIMKLVFDKFSELTNAHGANYARRKVLAGFVVTQGTEPEDARVVSLATGTKCINGEYISDQGSALNDCHAEIIARRSFKRYLFGQLALLLGTDEEKEQSIFTPKPTGGYKLKDNVQVHLYISTSPCGDARIFSPHEAGDGVDLDKHPNRKARGQLRTKIESGEGTIPVKSSPSIQTWDGVLQGERLLTMSCSDKVCKWNTVGLQGSLLSHFVEPVYLSSIILGSLYHADHLSRAMYGRLTNIQDLPPPYRVNKPYLSGISNPESRQPGKAPGFSVNWVVGDSHLEVINCTTGKDEQGNPSQVCKQSLFRLFQQLYGRISTITPPCEQKLSLYGDMKALVKDYQLAKEKLYKCFNDSGFGIWVGKPVEQDAFTLSQ